MRESRSRGFGRRRGPHPGETCEYGHPVDHHHRRNYRSRRSGSLAMAMVFVVLGVILTLFPGTSLRMICQVAGAAALIAGLLGIFYAVCNKTASGMISVGPMMGSIVLAVAGIFLLAQPELVASMIPMLLGFVILSNGILNLVQTWMLRSVRLSSRAALVLSLLTVMAGLAILFRPFAAASSLVRLIGILMIFNGLSNVWVTTRFEADMRRPRQFH